MVGDILVMAAADGIGGLNHGRAAAAVAIEAIRDELIHEDNPNIDYISSLAIIKIKQINQFIYNQSVDDNTQMGTTLSVLLLSPNKYISINIGDTLGLKITGTDLRIISQIHTLASNDGENPIDSLDSYVKAKNKNMLTRAVGIGPEVKAAVNIGEAKKGDYFILCTDGVYNFISNNEWLKLVNNNDNYNLKGLCGKIAQAALDEGSNDNVSLIIGQLI